MTTKLLPYSIILGTLTVAAVLYLNARPAPEPVPPVVVETLEPEDGARTYDSEEQGVRFRYPADYYLRQREVGSPERPLWSIVLVEDTQENRDAINGVSTVAREGPVSLMVDVYTNPNNFAAEEWIRESTNWMAGIQRSSMGTVGGAPAFMYEWDGLYWGRSAVVTRPGRAYVFSVTWMTEADRTLADYQALIESVTFFDPPSAPVGDTVDGQRDEARP